MSQKRIEDSTDNVELIKKLYGEGNSVKKIAKIFSIGETSLYRYFDRHGIKTRTKEEAYQLKRLTPEKEANVWDLYLNSGLNREGIATKLGYSQYAVRSVIDGNTLPGKIKFKTNYELNTVPLTYEQKQLVIGSLLGDAHLSFREHNGCQEQLEFGITHGEPQQEYLKYCANILGANVSEGIQGKDSFGAGNKVFKLSYSNKYELLKIANLVLVNGRKTITNEWMEEIDAPALAYWFMDDGTSSYANNKHKTVIVMFATQSFDRHEHDILRTKLDNLGIKTTLRKVNNGTGINIYVKQCSVNKLMEIIEPYISRVPCMSYKIKRKSI